MLPWTKVDCFQRVLKRCRSHVDCWLLSSLRASVHPSSRAKSSCPWFLEAKYKRWWGCKRSCVREAHWLILEEIPWWV